MTVRIVVLISAADKDATVDKGANKRSIGFNHGNYINWSNILYVVSSRVLRRSVAIPAYYCAVFKVFKLLTTNGVSNVSMRVLCSNKSRMARICQQHAQYSRLLSASWFNSTKKWDDIELSIELMDAFWSISIRSDAISGSTAHGALLSFWNIYTNSKILR